MWTKPVVLPTKLDALRRRYVHGEIDVDAFDAAVERLLASGRQHEPAELQRPAGLPPRGAGGPTRAG